MSHELNTAVDYLKQGGIIAYPTEAVWGLGCDPQQYSAVLRLLKIKQRPVEKGLILIAADIQQLLSWVKWDELPKHRQDAILTAWPGPYTWVIPAYSHIPHWLTGEHSSLAVRITAHPKIAELCRLFNGPIVSTSANITGQPAVFLEEQLDSQVISQIDYIIHGETSGLLQPTPIYNAITGEVYRE